jgi:hypothetical protein
MRGPNVARYRRARDAGETEVWIEGVCPDGEGGWKPVRRLYHVLELEARYGDATWDRAEIADDGSARIWHEGRRHVWRPRGHAPRPATNRRTRGSSRRCGTRQATGSGSRAGPRSSEDPDESDSASLNPLLLGRAGR